MGENGGSDSCELRSVDHTEAQSDALYKAMKREGSGEHVGQRSGRGMAFVVVVASCDVVKHEDGGGASQGEEPVKGVVRKSGGERGVGLGEKMDEGGCDEEAGREGIAVARQPRVRREMERE